MNNATPATLSTESYALSEKQVRYFNTFGFIKLPGLLAEEIEEIGAVFDEFMARDDVEGVPLDYAQGDRIMVAGMLNLEPRLSYLKEDPRILGVARSILGDDCEYTEGSGDILKCETTWHRDTYGSPLNQLHLKFLIYLEPLVETNGALRVMPGTNYIGDPYVDDVLRGQGFPDRMEEVFGVQGKDLPGTTIETVPGDVVALNFRTVHASFLGDEKRRMINLNYREPAPAKEPAGNRKKRGFMRGRTRFF